MDVLHRAMTLMGTTTAGKSTGLLYIYITSMKREVAKMKSNYQLLPHL